MSNGEILSEKSAEDLDLCRRKGFDLGPAYIFLVYSFFKLTLLIYLKSVQREKNKFKNDDSDFLTLNIMNSSDNIYSLLVIYKKC